jgi:hypothetical protein
MSKELEKIWKERVRWRPVVLSQHLPAGTEENHEKSCQNSRELNQEPTEHEAGVLTTVHSVRWQLSE